MGVMLAGVLAAEVDAPAFVGRHFAFVPRYREAVKISTTLAFADGSHRAIRVVALFG